MTVSSRVLSALERKDSAELLEMRRNPGLEDDVNAAIDAVLRARGVDPAAPPPPAPAANAASERAQGDAVVLAYRVRLVAWFQLLTAAVFAVLIFGAPSVGIGLAVALVAGVNAAAGLFTLAGQRGGFWLSVWNHAAQIPVLLLPGLGFHYVGLGGLVFIVTGGPGFFVNAQVNPGFELYLAPRPGPYGVGIDLLSVGIVALLLSALQKGTR